MKTTESTTNEHIRTMRLERLFTEHPFAKDFFDANSLPRANPGITVEEYVFAMSPVFLEDIGFEREGLIDRLAAFIERMRDVREGPKFSVRKITVLGGKDKSGAPESIVLDMHVGEILCIVGPTGSGKSRLLADIEWMAQGDTPTGRRILLDGAPPSNTWRFSLEHKLVAQLSQNMNFVMDISAAEFIAMHAESRMVPDAEAKVRAIIEQANLLAGEPFAPDTPVTALSGGQSRALMIADTAFLSTSPIILIDEIENAGINRKKAMELLVGREKIVLVATHDPLLALMGSRRIVIKNGGICKIIHTTGQEREQMKTLEKIDEILLGYRERLRNGETLDEEIDVENPREHVFS